MQFRGDWLQRVVSVPYVPTLGPVHPDSLSPRLFDDVVRASRTRRLLAYDKDQRWMSRKDHVVLAAEIIHHPDRTVIPTLSRRGHGTITAHHYSPTPPDKALAAQTRRLCATYGAQAGRLVWFEITTNSADPRARRTRTLVKTFDSDTRCDDTSGVRDLQSYPEQVRATFPAFAQRLAHHGFEFLYTQLAAGRVHGPILVAVADTQIVGAIGPMQTMPDPRGITTLLPQYFGVLDGHQGQGHGRALWRAAMEWGQRHGAVYQILQTRCGEAAERLFLSEGLVTLGFKCAESA